MNKKNAILGIAALLFSVGSAFASLLVNPVYLSVRYTGDAAGDFTCTSIQKTCTEGTGQVCIVDVNNPGSATDYNNQAVKIAGCSDVITSATPDLGSYIPSGGRVVIEVNPN